MSRRRMSTVAMVVMLWGVHAWSAASAYDGVGSTVSLQGKETTRAVVVQDAPGNERSTPVADRQRVGTPARIIIPRIAVNAVIEKVSLASDGSMDIPKKSHHAAWYAPGPRPGEVGSAAIAGHVNWKYGAPAVFVNLHKLKAGDVVVTRDDRGVDTKFIVRAVRTYAATADATDVFLSSDGKARLNLITCGGAWNARTRQYAKRLVVFTDRA